MISCEVCRRHLDAFVDGEVDPDTRIEFDQHLAECGPCRVHHAFALSFRDQVRESVASQIHTPPELLGRIRAALDQEDEDRARADAEAVHYVPVHARDRAVADRAMENRAAPAGRPLTPGAFASAGGGFWARHGVRVLPLKARYAVPAVAAAAVAAIFVSQKGGNPEIRPEGPEADVAADLTAASIFDESSVFEEIVHPHRRGHPAEVRGPEVETWVRERLEIPARPVEFDESTRAELVGARLSHVQDREAAAFFYDVNGHRVTVTVFEPPGGHRGRIGQPTRFQGRSVYYGQADGYVVPVVERRGLVIAVTGDLDSRSLFRLAASARVHR